MRSDEKTAPDMTTAIVHLYRGEMSRAESWRARMDTSTNWALTTAAAVVSFGLGTASAHHAVFLVGMFLVANFLFIESRRYRTWDVFLRRVRLLETSFLAPAVRGEPVDRRSMRDLAVALETPRIHISFLTAVAQRVKRAYGPLFLVLLSAWLVKLSVHASEMRGNNLIERMHVGLVPGWVVALLVLLVYGGLAALWVWSYTAKPPATELHSRRKRPPRPLREAFVRPATPVQDEQPA